MVGQSADKTEIRAEQSSCSIIGTRVLFSPLLLFMNICVGHVAHAILATSVCASRGEFQDFLQPVGENPPMRRVEDGSTSATIGGRAKNLRGAFKKLPSPHVGKGLGIWIGYPQLEHLGNIPKTARGP